jgi:hypothetical protein
MSEPVLKELWQNTRLRKRFVKLTRQFLADAAQKTE